jgi:hypothetical protein
MPRKKMKQAIAALGLILAIYTWPAAADDPPAAGPATAHEALKALQDYIGDWKGNGTGEGSSLWKESVSWTWRFKKNDAWLALDFPTGKHFKKGQLRHLRDKGLYQLTLVDAKNQKQVFEGKLDKGKLTLERVDAESKETQQLRINLAGGGVRFVYTYFVKPENRTIFFKRYQVAFTKEGESFAAEAEKKNECVVTGGLGTIAVSYNGMTYYVCCSGCRDAFNENPAKIIKEYLARKAKEKKK